MIPIALTTSRLVLDQPVSADRVLIAKHCTDPVFEQYMTTPWPYELGHAAHFVNDYVPMGWRTDAEYTWAIRRGDDFMGMIGYRTAPRMIGYWLGGPYRGHGYMTEACSAVVEWLFEQGQRSVSWECVPGNHASASVARKIGFTYTGTGPGIVASRDESYGPAWHASLAATDDRSEKPGWP